MDEYTVVPLATSAGLVGPAHAWSEIAMQKEKRGQNLPKEAKLQFF